MVFFEELIMYTKKFHLVLFSLQLIFSIQSNAAQDNLSRRKMYLKQILSVMPAEKPSRGPVSPLDATWQDWLSRTGELPPDFNSMPSLPYLPDPLIINEGRKNIPVKNMTQWNEKRTWMKK